MTLKDLKKKLHSAGRLAFSVEQTAEVYSGAHHHAKTMSSSSDAWREAAVEARRSYLATLKRDGVAVAQNYEL